MGQETEVHIFQKRAASYDFLVKLWKEVSSSSIAARGRFTVALSGGKTPGDFFTRLSEKPYLSWDKTYIFQVDERFVSPADQASNLFLIRETLTIRISLPDNNIHSITTEGIQPEESAKDYERELRRFFHNHETLPRLDLIMLGIGDDSHTASLFPGSIHLHETKRLVVPVVAKRFPLERISLTLPVINNARLTVFLATGEKKASVIRDILEKDSLLPAALVRPVAGSLVFVLDERVASLLSKTIPDA